MTDTEKLILRNQRAIMEALAAMAQMQNKRLQHPLYDLRLDDSVREITEALS